MDKFLGALGLVFGLGAILWIIWLEFRLRQLNKLWVRSALAARDAEIEKNISVLSDAELSALLDKRLHPAAKPNGSK